MGETGDFILGVAFFVLINLAISQFFTFYDEGLVYFKSDEDKAIHFFDKHGQSYRRQLSSEAVTRAYAAEGLGDYGSRAILMAPDLIDMLDDNTGLAVKSGGPFGPEHQVGVTSVNNYVLSALRRITGQDFGYNETEWYEWWERWWLDNKVKFKNCDQETMGIIRTTKKFTVCSKTPVDP